MVFYSNSGPVCSILKQKTFDYANHMLPLTYVPYKYIIHIYIYIPYIRDEALHGYIMKVSKFSIQNNQAIVHITWKNLVG